MCPKQLSDSVEGLVDFVSSDSRSIRAAHTGALPALVLTVRLQADPVVRGWVDELTSLAPSDREHRAHVIAKGAPRGIGQRLIATLLLRAALTGKAYSMLAGSTVAAFEAADPEPDAPQRAPKTGAHDKIGNLAITADRLTRRLVAYPAAIEPCGDASRRAEQRLLQEAAAHLLDEVISPASQRRRSAG